MTNLMDDNEAVQSQWVQWTVAVIGAAIIIGGAWWIISHRGAADSTKDVMEEATSGEDGAAMTAEQDANGTKAGMETGETSMVKVTAGTISVEDQAAGEEVRVASAALSQPGWIAVRDSNKWILGAGWFPGNVADASVPLMRATKAGETYEVLVYVDDGDKQFDFKKDVLVEGETTSFTAQ